MALADYYGRSALAASQVIAGFDETSFRRTLDNTVIGVGVSRNAARSPEGRTLLELAVRLLSRLYPAVEFRAETGTDEEAERLAGLARAINPKIEFRSGAGVGICVGSGSPTFAESFWAGSEGWDGYISNREPVPIASSHNPLGAAFAACLSAGEIFKRVFLPDWQRRVLGDASFSTYSLTPERTSQNVSKRVWKLHDDAVLVGVGAIGNAAAWTLSQAPLSGTLHLVDPQILELSNLQRYVLAQRDDERRAKVDIAHSFFDGNLLSTPHRLDWAEFLENHGYVWHNVLVALDSAFDRRSVQAALPEWIANAWTQPGDAGLSFHGSFDSDAACLSCLYLPQGQIPNEDELVAQALGIPNLVTDVRTLLYNGQGIGRPLLEAVAASLSLPAEQVRQWEGKSLRDLYVEGICGGALIPLGAAGAPRQELHVPLAHQSALAGVLLASALARHAIEGASRMTTITRIDVLGRLSNFATQPTQKAFSGTCVCEDGDFLQVFNRKYRKPSPVQSSRTMKAG